MNPAIRVGDKVRIVRHDLTTYIGHVGSVHSVGMSAQDRPTAFVRLADGGLFVNLEDLEIVETFISAGDRKARIAGLLNLPFGTKGKK